MYVARDAFVGRFVSTYYGSTSSAFRIPPCPLFAHALRGVIQERPAVVPVATAWHAWGTSRRLFAETGRDPITSERSRLINT